MKVDYYNGLEEKIRELGKYKPYFTKYNELRAIMEQLLEKVLDLLIWSIFQY